jgi:hypothetical protein
MITNQGIKIMDVASLTKQAHNGFEKVITHAGNGSKTKS